MKTTNYEISRQLAEAGFEAECAYLWFEKDQAIKIGDWIHPINKIEKINKEAISYLSENNKSYPAYDLETILEALPAFIENKEKEYHFWLWNDGMGYYPDYDKYSGEAIYDMDNGIFEFSEDKSLADTAAKLWLKLKKEGLV